MAKDKEANKEERKRWRRIHNGGTGAVYGLGFLGAVVYFLQYATTFWMVVLGILKALVWPALLIYKALELLKM
jgi:hypothetical protein